MTAQIEELQLTPAVLEDVRKRTSLGKQAAMGVVQGGGDIVQLINMIQGLAQAPLSYGLLDKAGRSAVATPGMEARARMETDPNITESQFIGLASEDDLMGQPMLPGQRTQLSESLASIPEEGMLQEGVRRGVRTLPGLIGGPVVAGEMLGREALGMVGQQTAKAAGFGEVGQALADIALSMTPDIRRGALVGGNKLIQAAETGAFHTEKEVIDAARRMGMNDAQIKPLINEGWFSRVLEHGAPRRGGMQRTLTEAKKGVSDMWGNFRQHPQAQKPISGQARQQLTREVQEALGQVPFESRTAIANDLDDLFQEQVTGEKIINVWGDINHHYNNHPKLQALKPALTRAIKSVSPELGNDFTVANTLSQRMRDVSRRLSPNFGSDAFGAGEAMGLVAAIATGNVAGMTSIVGVAAGRELAKHMLTSPRLHNLSKKMATTINAGQLKATHSIINQMAEELAGDSPEAAQKLRTITIEEIDELLKKTSTP